MRAPSGPPRGGWGRRSEHRSPTTDEGVSENIVHKHACGYDHDDAHSSAMDVRPSSNANEYLAAHTRKLDAMARGLNKTITKELRFQQRALSKDEKLMHRSAQLGDEFELIRHLSRPGWPVSQDTAGHRSYSRHFLAQSDRSFRSAFFLAFCITGRTASTSATSTAARR